MMKTHSFAIILRSMLFLTGAVVCFSACTKKSDKSNDQYIRFTLDGKETVFTQSAKYFQVPSSVSPNDLTTAFGTAALEEGASGYYVVENGINIQVMSRADFVSGVEYTNENPSDVQVSIGYLDENGDNYDDKLYEEFPGLSDVKITLTKIDTHHFEGSFNATVYANGDENDFHVLNGTFRLKD